MAVGWRKVRCFADEKAHISICLNSAGYLASGNRSSAKSCCCGSSETWLITYFIEGKERYVRYTFGDSIKLDTCGSLSGHKSLRYAVVSRDCGSSLKVGRTEAACSDA